MIRKDFPSYTQRDTKWTSKKRKKSMSQWKKNMNSKNKVIKGKSNIPVQMFKKCDNFWWPCKWPQRMTKVLLKVTSTPMMASLIQTSDGNEWEMRWLWGSRTPPRVTPTEQVIFTSNWTPIFAFTTLKHIIPLERRKDEELN